MCTIFECEKCQNVDSIFATPQTGPGYECHRCKTGEWHGQFPESKYNWHDHGPALNVREPVEGNDGQPSFS